MKSNIIPENQYYSNINELNFKMYICSYNLYGKKHIPREKYYEYIDYTDCNNKFNDTELLYSEYYQIYDILKNHKLPDYIGICHYRKYFKFSLQDIEKLKNKEYDIILPKPYRFGIQNYIQFVSNFDKYFLEVVKDIIKTHYPDYLSNYISFLNNDYIYAYSMMITNRDIFNDYCNFVFDIFDKFLKYLNINSIKDIENYIDNNSDKFRIEGKILSNIKISNYNKYLDIRKNFSRICGFLGERLLNVYVAKNNLKILERDIVIYDYEK